MPRQAIGSILRFTNYIVEKIDFEYNYDFQERKVPIDFDIDYNIEKNQNDFKVSLDVSIFKNPKQNNYPFSLYTRVSGFFQLQNTEENNKQAPTLEKNAIAILFPYVRALISSFTANANVNPLILPPINVLKLIEVKSQAKDQT